jgi:hypothetical protein
MPLTKIERLTQRLKKEFGLTQDEIDTLYGDDETKMSEGYAELKKSRDQGNAEDSSFAEDNYELSAEEKRSVAESKEIATDAARRAKKEGHTAAEAASQSPESFDASIRAFENNMRELDEGQKTDDEEEKEFTEGDGDEWKNS